MITKHEMQEVAEQAAEKALCRVFLTFGVDVKDPKAVLSLQQDLQHVRRWRVAQEQVKGAGLKAAVTFIVTGLLAALYLGVRAKFGLPPIPMP